MKKILRKCMTVMLIIALAVSTVTMSSTQTQAATSKVKLNKSSVEIKKGKSYTLKLQNNKKKIKWSSGNKKVATVSSKGKVKAKKDGTVTITAKAGSKKYKCKVTVYSLTASTKVGNSLKVTLKKAKSWKTSNSKVLKITKKSTGSATVKGMKAGTAYLSYKVGSTKTIIKITIKKATNTKTTVSKEEAALNQAWKDSEKKVVYLDEAARAAFKYMNQLLKKNGKKEVVWSDAHAQSAKWSVEWDALHNRAIHGSGGGAMKSWFDGFSCEAWKGTEFYCPVKSYDDLGYWMYKVLEDSPDHKYNMLEDNHPYTGWAMCIYKHVVYVVWNGDKVNIGDFNSRQEAFDYFDDFGK
ncbi:MAG: Ig-like domain-containing protein [Eubacterium sp.]